MLIDSDIIKLICELTANKTSKTNEAQINSPDWHGIDVDITLEELNAVSNASKVQGFHFHILPWDFSTLNLTPSLLQWLLKLSS